MYIIKLVSCIRLECKIRHVRISGFSYIPTVSIDRKNIVLTNFQSWVHMYPYHTETTTIIGIKPIAIHTN